MPPKSEYEDHRPVFPRPVDSGGLHMSTGTVVLVGAGVAYYYGYHKTAGVLVGVPLVIGGIGLLFAGGMVWAFNAYKE